MASSGKPSSAGDCNDAVATTCPGAPELCNGGVDDDFNAPPRRTSAGSTCS